MGVLDLTTGNEGYETKPDKAYWERRNASIERQVAVKCVAQVFEGAGYKFASDGIEEKDVVSLFNLFLKLIRG